MPFVFLNKRAADLWAGDHTEEWTNYKVKEVELRTPGPDEGVVGNQLVSIRRETVDETIRERALKKLTKEERHILGLEKQNSFIEQRAVYALVEQPAV